MFFKIKTVMLQILNHTTRRNADNHNLEQEFK
jgi:hypothetical protein